MSNWEGLEAFLRDGVPDNFSLKSFSDRPKYSNLNNMNYRAPKSYGEANNPEPETSPWVIVDKAWDTAAKPITGPIIEATLDASKTAVYAILALLWNMFAGGTGWAMLSLINEEHEELDPFLRPPLTLVATNQRGFFGNTVRLLVARASSFSIFEGSDPITLISSDFDVFEDRFLPMSVNRAVVNWFVQ